MKPKEKETIIEEGKLITCEKCGHQFRWKPSFNNTIAPKKCRICYNTELLERSNLATRKWKSKQKPTQYTIKERKSGKQPLNGSKKKRIKWTDKALDELIQYVQSRICNPYIRKRDATNFHKCISCNGRVTQAGHRYSVGDFPGMRFMIHNIHGQEISCNHFKSGNIDAYDRGLIARHGEEYQKRLKMDAERYLQNGHSKMNRLDVIQIGKTYKYLHENEIWIYTPEEFNHYRDIINGNI